MTGTPRARTGGACLGTAAGTRRPWRVAVAAWAAWGVVALLLYTPWHPATPDIEDFSDWMPLLRGAPGFLARQAAFGGRYALDGRILPLSLLQLNARWTLFGPDMVGWQWTQLGLMLAVVALAIVSLRRLGAAPAASAAAAGLFVVGWPAQQGWLNPAVCEPLGTLFLLGAVALAAGYSTSRRPLASGVGVLGCLVCALLSKETLVTTAPFVVLVAACHTPGEGWHRPRVTGRVVALGLACAAICVGEVRALHLARERMAAGSYTTGMGEQLLSARRLGQLAHYLLLPTSDSPAHPAGSVLLQLALAIGARATLGPGAHRDSTRWPVISALVLAASGFAMYAGWPRLSGYYALPYLAGPALLLALALTKTEGRSRVVAWAAAITALLFSGGSAVTTAREVWGGVVRTAIASAGDTVLVAAQDGQDRVPGRVRRYMLLLAADSAPTVRRVPCAAIERALREGRVPVVVFAEQCGPERSRWQGEPAAVVARFPSLDRLGLPMGADSLAGAVWQPRRPVSPVRRRLAAGTALAP